MEELFIPEEQSLKLRNLGFNELCLARFDGGGFQMLARYDPLKNSEIQEPWFSVTPTWEQAFSWFRNKYKLNNLIYEIELEDLSIVWTWDIVDNFSEAEDYDLPYSDTYEEARLACLNKLIEIL